MQFSPVHPPLHQPILCVPLDPKRQGGGNPVRDGPAIPSSESLCVASLNARRLWQRDQSVHDEFRVNRLSSWESRFAGDFPTSPSDQPYTCDGPVGSGGREAAFLVRAGVCGSPVPGVADSTSVRWQVFNNAWCICSCRVATGDPCQFLAGFCRCCSACAECSQRSNGHRRRRQRVASSLQPLSIPIVRCAYHPNFGFAHGFLQTGVEQSP